HSLKSHEVPVFLSLDRKCGAAHAASQLSSLGVGIGTGRRFAAVDSKSQSPTVDHLSSSERTILGGNIPMRKSVAATLGWLLMVPGLTLAQARLSRFQHIVVVVQENRTPDNLFQGLCLSPYGNPNACGTGFGQFDIQSYGNDSQGNKVPLAPVPLGSAYDPPHSHRSFEVMC